MKFLNNIEDASKLVQDSTHRLVTDAEKAVWNDPASAVGLGAIYTRLGALEVDNTSKTYVDAQDALKADKATTYTKTEVDTKDATKADKLMATNIVTNGDFGNETTGWGISTLLSATVLNNELTALANSQYDGVSQGATAIVGNKYYFRLFVKATSNLVRLLPNWGLTKSHSGSGNYELLSYISTATTASLSNGAVDTRTTGFDNFYVKYGLALNLTATFGAGNEPTKEQMDRLLAEFPNSWFDGTAELMSLKSVVELLDEKANKTQEEWITPTLLNGATQVGGSTEDFAYMKDSMGFVHFKGSVNVGSPNYMFSLPVGYRGKANKRMHFMATGIGTFAPYPISIYGGEVWGYPGKSMAFDGISFKAEG